MAPSSKILRKIHFILPVYLLLLTLSCGFANAQSLDDKGSKIFKESQATIESLQDLSFNFAYTTLNNAQNDRSKSQKGTFRIKGDKFVLDMEEQVIYCDGITQWIHIPDMVHDVEELTIIHYDPEEVLNPNSFFQIFDLNTQIQYKGVESIQNRSHHKIFLVNADKSLNYNEAVLWIEQSTKLPSKVLLKDKLNTSTEILFTNIKINQNLPDNGFVFDITNFRGDVYDER